GRSVVDVELHHLQMARALAALLLDRGRDHAAWSAPRRPEVDQHRHRGPDLRGELVRRGIDDPGQHLMAVAAPGNALGHRRDAVLLAAVRAADNAHATAPTAS